MARAPLENMGSGPQSNEVAEFSHDAACSFVAGSVSGGVGASMAVQRMCPNRAMVNAWTAHTASRKVRQASIALSRSGAALAISDAVRAQARPRAVVARVQLHMSRNHCDDMESWAVVSNRVAWALQLVKTFAATLSYMFWLSAHTNPHVCELIESACIARHG